MSRTPGLSERAGFSSTCPRKSYQPSGKTRDRFSGPVARPTPNARRAGHRSAGKRHPECRSFSRLHHHHPRLGCLLAIDDFGAGHSNFDRILQLNPGIVTLDRRFARQIENNLRARRLLPLIVALLHEASAFVLLEGLELHTQAMIAQDPERT